jgi:class 3 adenylate cyclase/tetratricopeptide (TPR) repeat protein
MTTTATVTILFTDVVGSSELRTSRGDESAHKMMEAHFELVRQQIEQCSGQEIKTIGDSFMVAFASARSAVNCAVAVQRALAEHNGANPDEQVQVRIGLNTGEAIEKEGDLFGAAVDAASRIMSKAAGGQVLVSEHTRGVIGTAKDVSLIDRGPFWLKGFPERWRLYEVIWHEDRISTAAVLPHIGQRTPFVGRESERADLRRYLEAARGGHGSLVMIGGEPGVGKTRITEELATEARRHGFLTLTGHCYEMEGAPPYIPFVEIIESAARIVEPTALFSAMGASAPEVAKLMPELRHKFPDIPEPPPLPPEQERRRMFNGVLDFISRAAHAQPLLLVLEDLHWADESTMLLLQHIVQRLQEIPVLTVGTYRDTELDVARSLAKALEELLRQRLAHDMILRRLPEADVSAMLKRHSEQVPPARLVELIYRETEGNPFFVEEIFKHFSEEGKLFNAKGDWRSDVEIGEAEVPRGVRLVIGRRLERVSEKCRRTLSAAAIIGRGFSFDLLEELVNLDEDSLFDSIEAAEQAQLITSKTEGGRARFIFSHELIRQTLVSSLSLARRQRSHLKVAEAIEQLHAGALEEHAADLSYHFYQGGGDPEKTIEYSALAAERAFAQTAYEETVAQYQRALQALEHRQPVDEFRRCDLLLALATAYTSLGNLHESEKKYFETIDIARSLPAPEQFARAVIAIATQTSVVGVPDEQILGLVEEGLTLLPEEDSAARALLLSRLSEVIMSIDGTLERRLALSEDALSMARRVGDPLALGLALGTRTLFWHLPATEKIALLKEALEVYKEEARRPEYVGWTLVFLHHNYIQLGDIGSADHALTELKECVAELSLPANLFHAANIEAMRAFLAGEFDATERLAFEALSHGQKSNQANAMQYFSVLLFLLRWHQGRLIEIEDVFLAEAENYSDVPAYQTMLAILHLEMGRKEPAREIFERLAANEFTDLPQDLATDGLLMNLSELAFAFGDERRAALLYDLLLPLSDRQLIVGLNCACIGASTRWLGMLAATMKRWDDAVDHFENAIETNARIGARPFLARTQHEYARMLIERNEAGDKEKAKALLTEAIATYRELGMPTFLEDAEELMGKL